MPDSLAPDLAPGLLEGTSGDSGLDPLGGVPLGSPGYDQSAHALARDIGGLGQATWQMVKVPGDVFQGKYSPEQLPGVARDFAGSIAGAGLALPAPPAALRMFGGVKAATADLGKLADAQRLEAAGSSPGNTWAMTDW